MKEKYGRVRFLKTQCDTFRCVLTYFDGFYLQDFSELLKIFAMEPGQHSKTLEKFSEVMVVFLNTNLKV